jgi:predicted transcriptional regulator YheO
MPSDESAKANRSIDFIIDRSNHQSKKNRSCEMRSIETGQLRMRSIDFIIDRSNLDIFGTIWNNVDMSLFLDILNILDIF